MLQQLWLVLLDIVGLLLVILWLVLLWKVLCVTAVCNDLVLSPPAAVLSLSVLLVIQQPTARVAERHSRQAQHRLGE